MKISFQQNQKKQQEIPKRSKEFHSIKDSIDHNRFDWLTTYKVSKPRKILKYIEKDQEGSQENRQMYTQNESTANGICRKSIQYYKDLYKKAEGKQPTPSLTNQESVFAIKEFKRNEFTSKRGKRMVKYDLTICDNTGSLPLSIFSDSLERIFSKEIEIEGADGVLNNWQERPFLHMFFDVSSNDYSSEGFSFDITKAEFVDFDQVNINELLETPKSLSDSTDLIEMYEKLHKEAEQIKDPVYRKITVFLLENNREGYLYIPAAKSVHEENVGGLLEHTLRVLEFCKGFAVYPEDPINTDLLYSGAILHDIGKLVEFDPSQNGLVEAYSAAGNLMGHLHIGASIVEKAYAACIERNGIDDFGIARTEENDEKIACLCHLILSHHKEPEFGAVVQPKILEAVLLHEADTVDATIKGYEKAYKNTKPGRIADNRSFFLGNVFVYRPSDVCDDKLNK